ncbi:MAG TPA: hypothetical protein VFO10_01900 [Oligoflexus sp.]|uniref:hypothetical protein n=1 Tax=Oligoflexus sp. TaxID=1971216 RepID=UPI002D7E919F|nr:hypothetical protein [Oligoflexus sp.]HET9235971.1 hypothetical protein [Oligoflexus sp.]
MKVLAHLCTAALFFASSLGLALPKVSVDVLSEVQKVDQVIQELDDYESRVWAIGINGDTLQPDQFQKFFADRDMEVRYFVRSFSGLSLGEASAYQENRRMLVDYRHRILQQELAEVNAVVRQIQIAQQQDASVGFTTGMMQPDQTIRFFGQRGLEIRYYVRGPSFTLGDASAYQQNLKVLGDYARKLRSLDKSLGR